MPPEKFSATEANRKRDTIFYVNARMSQASLNSAWLLTEKRLGSIERFKQKPEMNTFVLATLDSGIDVPPGKQ